MVPSLPISSKPLFSDKNKTEEVLGSPEEREKVVLQLNDIFTDIIDSDVMTIQLEDRCGILDEIRIHFSMTNGNNDFFRLAVWEQSPLSPDAYQDSPRAKFDKACLVLRARAGKRLEHIAKTEKIPVQEGPCIHP